MPAGLYGKLPAKRDFVAANTPRRFLEVWEPWLQAGVATSKQVLGEGWSEAYLNAPIWRFWRGGAWRAYALDRRRRPVFSLDHIRRRGLRHAAAAGDRDKQRLVRRG